MIRAACEEKKMRNRHTSLVHAVLIAAFIALVLPLPARCEDGSSFITLKGGRFMPHPAKNASRDNGPMEEVAIGYFLSPDTVLELGIGYFKSELHFSTGPRFKINATPVTLTFKGVQVGENFMSTIGIGAGFYDEELRTISGAAFIQDREMVSGYHFSFGYDFFIGEHASAGFEYKILRTQTAEFKNDSGALVRTDMSGDSFLATVGYRF